MCVSPRGLSRVALVYDAVVLCFFKQKTAYEMRISDWSSGVCSSDLGPHRRAERQGSGGERQAVRARPAGHAGAVDQRVEQRRRRQLRRERKSGVEGKRVSVRVDLGGRRNRKKRNESRVRR